MSADEFNSPETHGLSAPPEIARSSVKLIRNAKGNVQFEVRVYAPEDNDADFAAKKAVAIVRSLEAEFPWRN
jgi:hypothetical protein